MICRVRWTIPPGRLRERKKIEPKQPDTQVKVLIDKPETHKQIHKPVETDVVESC